jgi:hypothetical protein
LGYLHRKLLDTSLGSALSAKGVTPFDIKGGRQARLLAEKIVEHSGVPENFAGALMRFRTWVDGGCARGVEITMTIA